MAAGGHSGQHPSVMQPVGPVFLLDGGDVVVLKDPADAQRELEPFLADEPVEIFDALARPLRLVVEGRKKKRGFFTVDERRIVRLEVASNERAERHLRAALVLYLRRTGQTVPDEPTWQGFASTVSRLIS